MLSFAISQTTFLKCRFSCFVICFGLMIFLEEEKVKTLDTELENANELLEVARKKSEYFEVVSFDVLILQGLVKFTRRCVVKELTL